MEKIRWLVDYIEATVDNQLVAKIIYLLPNKWLGFIGSLQLGIFQDLLTCKKIINTRLIARGIRIEDVCYKAGGVNCWIYSSKESRHFVGSISRGKGSQWLACGVECYDVIVAKKVLEKRITGR